MPACAAGQADPRTNRARPREYLWDRRVAFKLCVAQPATQRHRVALQQPAWDLDGAARRYAQGGVVVLVRRYTAALLRDGRLCRRRLRAGMLKLRLGPLWLSAAEARLLGQLPCVPPRQLCTSPPSFTSLCTSCRGLQHGAGADAHGHVPEAVIVHGRGCLATMTCQPVRTCCHVM